MTTVITYYILLTILALISMLLPTVLYYIDYTNNICRSWSFEKCVTFYDL